MYEIVLDFDNTKQYSKLYTDILKKIGFKELSSTVFTIDEDLTKIYEALEVLKTEKDFCTHVTKVSVCKVSEISDFTQIIKKTVFTNQNFNQPIEQTGRLYDRKNLNSSQTFNGSSEVNSARINVNTTQIPRIKTADFDPQKALANTSTIPKIKTPANNGQAGGATTTIPKLNMNNMNSANSAGGATTTIPKLNMNNMNSANSAGGRTTTIPKLNMNNMNSANSAGGATTTIPKLNMNNMNSANSAGGATTTIPKLNMNNMNSANSAGGRTTTIPKLNMNNMNSANSAGGRTTTIPKLNMNNMNSANSAGGATTTIPKLNMANAQNGGSMTSSLPKINVNNSIGGSTTTIPKLNLDALNNMNNGAGAEERTATIPKINANNGFQPASQMPVPRVATVPAVPSQNLPLNRRAANSKPKTEVALKTMQADNERRKTLHSANPLGNQSGVAVIEEVRAQKAKQQSSNSGSGFGFNVNNGENSSQRSYSSEGMLEMATAAAGNGQVASFGSNNGFKAPQQPSRPKTAEPAKTQPKGRAELFRSLLDDDEEEQDNSIAGLKELYNQTKKAEESKPKPKQNLTFKNLFDEDDDEELEFGEDYLSNYIKNSKEEKERQKKESKNDNMIESLLNSQFSVDNLNIKIGDRIERK